MRFLTLSDRGIYIFSIVISVALLTTLQSMPLISKIFPMALLFILFAVSLVLLFLSRKGYEKIDLTKYRNGYIIYAIFAVYIVVVPVIGYFPATAVFLLVSTLLIKPKASKITTGIATFVLAGALTISFSYFLRIPLP